MPDRLAPAQCVYYILLLKYHIVKNIVKTVQVNNAYVQKRVINAYLSISYENETTTVFALPRLLMKTKPMLRMLLQCKAYFAQWLPVVARRLTNASTSTPSVTCSTWHSCFVHGCYIDFTWSVKLLYSSLRPQAINVQNTIPSTSDK